MLKQKVDNPRYPHLVVITRVDFEDEFSDETLERTLYDGMGRGFTDTTTTGGTEVDVNKRKASIPVRFDKWTEPILDGDKIRVVKTDGVVENGRVRDFEPDNDRTIIYWEVVRV